MGFLIQFGAALVLLTGAVYLTSRRSYTRGFLDGLKDGRKETQQLSYHEGYADGTWEGRLKAQLEYETKAAKLVRDYEQGWADALHAVECETYAAMASDATIRLSA